MPPLTLAIYNKLTDVCGQGVQDEEKEQCQNRQNNQSNDVFLVFLPDKEHKGLHWVHKPVKRCLGATVRDKVRGIIDHSNQTLLLQSCQFAKLFEHRQIKETLSIDQNILEKLQWPHKLFTPTRWVSHFLVSFLVQCINGIWYYTENEISL